MIAMVSEAAVRSRYVAFLDALRARGFEGEIAPDYANRTVLATDNSIYQRLPQAAVYPKHAEDLERLTRLAAQTTHRDIVLTPRGGGTGTNGQSLTDGIVVDVSRHMNKIIEIDVDARRVRVQAGVIKDQLNAALKPHGLFFAPELSTSNRATIGGMISTDASGQGSCEYGKTRDHVLQLDTILIGGKHLHSRALTSDEEQAECQQEGILGRVHTTAANIIDQQRELIAAKFPPLNRCLTGYDLAHLRDDKGQLNLNSLLCGSEGSLGFLNEAVLNVLPIPKHSTLVNVRYTSFMDALRDAKALMTASAQPTSIETIDDTVLQLAMEDFVWDSVAGFFPATGSTAIRGINLIEFNDDDESALAERVRAFTDHLSQDTTVERLGYTLAEGRGQIQKVYAMRKRSVGLLGNVQGEKRPIPFVEDTAVPPEHLAEFIAEFRAALDARGLSYGMFGHVDAGVLHVRPAIDMKDPEQEKLIRAVSDEVAALTQKYGGLLWGEHGKGVRSEYSPKFFGELYPSLQRVKAAFDPFNQLNPGKIASPLSTPPEAAGRTQSGELIAKDSDPDLLTVDGVPMRGQFDRTIDERAWQAYD
ncbi:FAD-binding oxidoreductase, partial [Halomonas campaniensis]